MIIKKQVEELLLWKEVRDLTSKINLLTNEKAYLEERHLRVKTRTATLTALNSIGEGYGRESNEEFVHYLNTSLGAMVDLESRLYEAMDRDVIDMAQYTEFYKQNRECCRMVMSLMEYLKDLEAYRKAG